MVVDSSVVLEVLLRTPRAAGIEARLGGELWLHAPHLIDLELIHVLRRYAALGDLDDKRAMKALTAFGDLPILRYPHHDLLPRVWELRANWTAYDAAYIALAEVLDATLLTRDQRLSKSPGHFPRVEVL